MDIFENLCTYCGDNGQLEADHVIPVSYLGVRVYDSKIQWIVPACRICNSLAGCAMFFSIPEKANYIASRYKIKYRKVLRCPFWTKEEMKTISRTLRSGIEETMLAKRLIQERIKNLEMVGMFSESYKRPDWITNTMTEMKEKMKIIHDEVNYKKPESPLR